jgi:hypothetical protein
VETKEIRIMTENLAFAAACAIAPIMGGALEGAGDDTWRGRFTLADGLQIIIAKPYGSKGEVYAYLPRPGYPGDSVKCGQIGADVTKDPAKLERDIARRLLPGAREKAAAAREKWAAQEDMKSALESLAVQFGAIPGVRVTVNDAGRADQHMRISYYESDKGRLTATVYGSGSVYVDSVSLYGNTGKLAALIAALAA